MRPELNLKKVKEELVKLTDVEYLKKELLRLANEIKHYDLNEHLTPQAKSRMRTLEKRFQEIRKAVIRAEKQIGSEVNKLVMILRKASAKTKAKVSSLRMGKKKKPQRKASSKKASKKTV